MGSWLIMHLDADFRAEAQAADRFAEPIRAACAYLTIGLGITGTLAIIPALIAMLAARGFQ